MTAELKRHPDESQLRDWGLLTHEQRLAQCPPSTGRPAGTSVGPSDHGEAALAELEAWWRRDRVEANRWLFDDRCMEADEARNHARHILALALETGEDVTAAEDAFYVADQALDLAIVQFYLAHPAEADNANTAPVDIWAERARPTLPANLLPPVIETFARRQGELMGVDPGGLAMAALTVAAAAIPDSVKLQVKRHDPSWTESARLWCALIGSPSTKKSPTISIASAPLRQIDDGLLRSYVDRMVDWERLDKAQKALTPPPRQERTRIEDVTVEAAQQVLADNEQGLLLIRDELSAWFGSMEKYGSSKASASDRGFWLQAFNGGSYAVNRVGRGAALVPNLSVSLLGGIQPEPIRAISKDLADDGLMQRLVPICLGSASVGTDAPAGSEVGDYRDAISRMRRLRSRGDALRFSPSAHSIRAEREKRHHELAMAWETVNRKIGAHLGKYDALFARLCIVFHCLDEMHGDVPVDEIGEDVAERVAAFMDDYIYRHLLAFYTNVLGAADDQDEVTAVAGYILAHRLESISVSEARRGDRKMRQMTEDKAKEVLGKLDAFGWLTLAAPSARNATSTRYKVTAAVHTIFAERAAAEARRREHVRAIIADGK
ncbi:DUF3987 domain-containing protein [Devosia sediminis]|uniref:DUF3987 domain-containing protein n=1 Tax=Devosia sediminis TaxID=2798801 RepID=A0A934MJA8_9HYPH|nr:DUF3987 domain-containing protein [Devosia sediminis]MBJ3783858.1 DUF3987 domain-containing protein [Devosia sediminis]